MLNAEPAWLMLAEADIMLIADPGRVMLSPAMPGLTGRPERPLLRVPEPQVSGVKRDMDEGCWLTQKTKVLLITSR